MITDIFAERYPHLYFSSVPDGIYKIFRQARVILFDDLSGHISEPEAACKTAITKLTREICYDIQRGHSYFDICKQALIDDYEDYRYDFSVETHDFVIHRLSLIELLLQAFEDNIRSQTSAISAHDAYLAAAFRKPQPVAIVEAQNRGLQALRQAIDELNQRFVMNGIPLHYHSGKIQLTGDGPIHSQIEEPFWRLITGKKWENVVHDMQIALDHRDNNRDDPALYASMALESTIKIISDDKGWTSGNEKGAANFIDNLVSKGNGRFIDPWEQQQLTAIFRDIRNAHGHGPGSAPQPKLTRQQTNWVIESAMSWIKSLVERM